MKKSSFRFYLLASIIFFSVVHSHSENLLDNEFLIEGEISGVEDGTIINLIRWDEHTGKRIASDTLRSGRFIFKEKAESNTDKLSISPRGDGFSSKMLYVWVAPGVKVEIKGNGKLHPLWEVKSSVPYQKEQNLYTDKSRDIIAESARISIERNKAGSKIMAASSREESIPYRNIVDSLDVIGDSLMVIEYSAYVDILEKTNITPIWLEKMRNIALLVEPSKENKKYYGELRKKVEVLYERMSEEDKQTSYGAHITARLFPSIVVEIGDDFADTDLLDASGNVKHLANYLGKYLLLDFWSRGCGPCIMALPEMKEISETYSEKLTIISISLDTDAMWKEAMNKHDMPWVNIRDPKSYGGLAANYGVRGIPNYIMISPEGKIIDKWMGFSNGSLKKNISKNIK